MLYVLSSCISYETEPAHAVQTLNDWIFLKRLYGWICFYNIGLAVYMLQCIYVTFKWLRCGCSIFYSINFSLVVFLIIGKCFITNFGKSDIFSSVVFNSFLFSILFNDFYMWVASCYHKFM